MSCLGLFLALSMHIGLEGDYNNVHPHARCTVDNSIAGVYYNSEDRISAYVGKEFELTENGKLELGLVTGYKSEDILPMIRYKAGTWFISPAYERYDNKENHLTYALQLLTGRMHALQTLYNPQAHKQVRGVIGGGNVFQYVPGTNSATELNFKQGTVANLFEDPKVIDPATQQKMGESFKKMAGFRMPKELRLSTFENQQATKGTGGLWDQYVAWGEEIAASDQDRPNFQGGVIDRDNLSDIVWFKAPTPLPVDGFVVSQVTLKSSSNGIWTFSLNPEGVPDVPNGTITGSITNGVMNVTNITYSFNTTLIQ